jgi:hypothetical protein
MQKSFASLTLCIILHSSDRWVCCLIFDFLLLEQSKTLPPDAILKRFNLVKIVLLLFSRKFLTLSNTGEFPSVVVPRGKAAAAAAAAQMAVTDDQCVLHLLTLTSRGEAASTPAAKRAFSKVRPYVTLVNVSGLDGQTTSFNRGQEARSTRSRSGLCEERQRAQPQGSCLGDRG